MNISDIAAQVNAWHPRRDWHLMCQALVYWAGVAIAGDDKHRRTYGRAIWAYDASYVESLDPLTAPAGAVHYWLYPVGHGHVAIELGGGTVLMTGTPHELGAAGVQYGTNYGTTTIASFMARDTQEYLGWSLTNGDNLPLGDYFDAPITPPTKGKKKMFLCYYEHAGGENQGRWAFFGPSFWLELSTHAATVRFKRQIGMTEDSFDCGNQENWDRFKAVSQGEPVAV